MTDGSTPTREDQAGESTPAGTSLSDRGQAGDEPTLAGRVTPKPSLLRRLRPSPKVFILVAVAALISYVALVPLIYLIWGTIWDGQRFTLDFFFSAYRDIGLFRLLRNSFVFAGGSTALGLFFGTSIAYLTARTDVACRRALVTMALVPLVIPGVLFTIAWILLASPRNGWFNVLLRPIFAEPLFNIFSMPGMILVESLNRMPLVFLMMYAAFRNMDPALEESALMSGAKLGTVTRLISLPLVKPAIASAILILMIRALESFEVPALLGRNAGIDVFTSRIWRVMQGFPPGYGEAGAYSATLLCLTTLGIVWQARVQKRSRAFQTVSGKGFRPQRIALRKWRWPLFLIPATIFVLWVVMPLLILVWASFQRFYMPPTLAGFATLTTENYGAALGRRATTRALRNSTTLAFSAATTVMFVMAIASWIVIRTRIRGRWILDNLAFVPLAIPGLVLGVSLLFVYLRSPLPIYGSLWILFIAYFTLYMPYGMRYASTSMVQISDELEESAETSGATWWQTFRMITLPLLAPGLLAGWVFIALVAMRELSASILLYSPGTEVIAVIIFEAWTDGRLTQLAAIGVLLILVLVTIVAVAQRVGARFGVQESV